MTRRVIRTANAPRIPLPVSQAVAYGPLVFVGGQAGVDPQTGCVRSEHFEDQLTQALENLKAVVQAAGSTMDQALKVTVYLRDMGDYDKVNPIYARFFPSDPPARKVIQTVLPGNLLVEVDAIVAAPHAGVLLSDGTQANQGAHEAVLRGRPVDLTLNVDRTLPRWKLDVRTRFGPECYQSSTIGISVHAATHVDAPLHYVKDGQAIDQIPLERLMGPASVIDLSEVGADQAITAELLMPHTQHVQEKDIILLCTDWPNKRWGSMAFWLEAPYLTEDATDYLISFSPKAVGYDFPQEFAIRRVEQGETVLASDFFVHQKLLCCGIPNIEYLINLDQIKGRRVQLVAFPLKLSGLDGAPARVVAFV